MAQTDRSTAPLRHLRHLERSARERGSRLAGLRVAGVDTGRTISNISVVNLALKALISRLDAAARVQGVTDFRVLYRRNKRGELVVAILLTDLDGPFSKDTLGE